MSKDRLRYFRIEARELVQGLEQGLLAVERGGNDAERFRLLLRLAHTFKGAARVVGEQAIGDLAHALEDRLAAWRDADTEPEPAAVSELLAAVDELRARTLALDPPGAATPTRVATTTPASPEPKSRSTTARVELTEVDALLESLFEVAVSAAAARRDRHSSQAVGRHLEALQNDLTAAMTAAERLRLVPVDTIFVDLQRAVRDAAVELGRSARLETTGGDVRIDTHVLSSLRDGLLHIVRNAVAHGLESDADRLAAGKSAPGVIALHVHRLGGRVTVRCSDDGRGIGGDAVRRALIARRGWTDAAAAALTYEQLVEELGRGGLSTRAEVSLVAGRGVGLDVVHAVARELGGEVRLESVPGSGTTIDLTVPYTLAALRALEVESGAHIALVPLDAVLCARRLEGPQGHTAAPDTALEVDGELVPVIRLASVLGQEEPASAGAERSVVVVKANGRAAALAVERLGRVVRVVVRGLPPTLAGTPVVAGACLEVDGPVRLMLSPTELVALAARAPSLATRVSLRERAPILIIDDSVTTRMLEQSILESAGFEVALATSAEEGLEMAVNRRYGLFIVDVEMPGMSGFEYLEAARREPALRDVPAVIVTSRGDPEDIRRGKELGARAYIVKGHLDQHVLLEAVHRLLD